MAEPTARDVGEFGLIAAVTARLPQSAAVLLGPGDDAAVVAFPEGRVVATQRCSAAYRTYSLTANGLPLQRMATWASRTGSTLWSTATAC